MFADGINCGKSRIRFRDVVIHFLLDHGSWGRWRGWRRYDHNGRDGGCGHYVDHDYDEYYDYDEHHDYDFDDYNSDPASHHHLPRDGQPDEPLCRNHC